MKYNMTNEMLVKFDFMRFVDVDELFIKKNQIREQYCLLNFGEKEVYKWYFFYQLSLLKWRNKEKRPIKDCFWDYLNEITNEKEVNEIYSEFCMEKDILCKFDKNSNI